MVYREIKVIIVVIFATLFFPLISESISLRLINFQGRLTDQQGNPLDGQYTIKFSLYLSSDPNISPSPLWTEEHINVSASHGLVNVPLGSKTSFDEPVKVTFDQERYLGITIDCDHDPNTKEQEMTPRQRILPAIYAYTADTAHNADNAYDADKLDGKDGSEYTTPQTDAGRPGVVQNLYEGNIRLMDKYLQAEGSTINGNLNITGNVGIGTTSPGSKLQVVGNIYTSDGIDHTMKTVDQLQNNTTLRGGIYQNSGDGLKNASGSALAFGGWWHVINMHHQHNNGYNAQIAVPFSTSNDNIVFRTSGNGTWNEWRKVLSESSRGYVGIGTSAPRAALDVTGGGVFNQIAIGASVYGALNFPYETIQIYPGHNLRIAFGSSEKVLIANDGNIKAHAFLTDSDERLKEEIKSLENPLQKILQLKGISFKWKETGEPSIGLTAQNLEKVYPELVATNLQTGIKSIQLENLIAPLIEAIKELNKEKEELKERITVLERVIHP